MLINIIKNFFDLISKLVTIRKLIRLNRKLFNSKHNTKDGLILVEFFGYYPSVITFSFFSFILSKKHSSKIISYFPRPLNLYRKLKFKIIKFSIYILENLSVIWGRKHFVPLIGKNKYLVEKEKCLIN